MTEHETTGAVGLAPWVAAFDYTVDAWQRGVLFLDVVRQRGNQYLEHMAKQAPHVLQFQGELVVDGRKLPRPVNYGLVRITPPAGVAVHPELIADNLSDNRGLEPAPDGEPFTLRRSFVREREIQDYDIAEAKQKLKYELGSEANWVYFTPTVIDDHRVDAQKPSQMALVAW